VLLTGNKRLGFSDDTAGVNQPPQFRLVERWFTHFNAGLTFLPDAYTGHNALDYNLGASVIYATSDLHFCSACGTTCPTTATAMRVCFRDLGRATPSTLPTTPNSCRRGGACWSD
jgi:hypothetical protein